MPTTLNKIAEQIRRIHYGGNPSDDAEFTIREIKELVIQVINRLLKVEQIQIHEAVGDKYPSHHLITTYEGVTVEPSYSPTVAIVCTPIEGDNEAVDIQVDVVSKNPDIYNITIQNLSLSGITAAAFQAAIDDASSSCILSLGVASETPNNFLIAGITDLVVSDTQVAFTYSPIVDNQVWLLPNNGGWLIDDTFYWVLEEGTNATSGIPQIILDYVQDSHDLLDLVDVSETYLVTVSSFSICCPSTNELDIFAKAALPASPITLPKGMGVWRVYPPNQPEQEFIPLSSQQLGAIGATVHTNMSSIFANVNAYEWFDNRNIRFNQPASVVGSTVTVQLLVHDFAKTEHDSILPIPADMENTVIEKALQDLSKKGPIDRTNDDLDQP